MPHISGSNGGTETAISYGQRNRSRLVRQFAVSLIFMKTTRVRKKSIAAPHGRSARLEARISYDQKALIERAAAYERRTVTDFVVGALASAAEAVVRDHETIRLNAEQSRNFVEQLLNPREPNAALKRAVRRHRKSVTAR